MNTPKFKKGDECEIYREIASGHKIKSNFIIDHLISNGQDRDPDKHYIYWQKGIDHGAYEGQLRLLKILNWRDKLK